MIPSPVLGAQTRYAGCSRGCASVVLLATGLATAWCLWVSQTQHTGQLEPPASGKKRDTLLFLSVVERVHAGEGYYEAWGSEARSRGYPCRSVFNWRLPIFAWLNGCLPSLV